MKSIINLLKSLIMMAVFMVINHLMGFEYTMCLISAMILVEIWEVNIEKNEK